MSHDLAVWPGPLPPDAESACREYSRRMIAHGIRWYQERTFPEPGQQVMDFARHAVALLEPTPEDPQTPWWHPMDVGRIWGDVVTFELDGPQPGALAVLAQVADHHDVVLFDLLAHRVLTPRDITATFGEPVIPVPRIVPLRERLLRCRALSESSDELGVIAPNEENCSRRIDPFEIVPLRDELARFQHVLEDFDLADLQDLSDRLEDLIRAVALDDEPV